MANYDEKAELLLQDLLHVPDDVAVCGLVLGSLCSLSAVVGNFLIAAAFLSERSLRRRQNTFVVSAAITEILLVFMRDTFTLGVYALRSWQFGDKIMQANNVIFICRNGIAIGHVIAVTVYRYALIVHPRAYRILAKSGVIAVTLVLLFLIPLSTGLAVVSWEFVFNTKPMFCVRLSTFGIYNGTLHEDRMGGNPIPSFVYISLNAAILVFCNVHIYVFIKRSSARVAGSSGGSQAATNTGKQPAVAKRSTKKEVRFVKIMAIIFATFMVSYYVLPLVIALDKRWSLSHWSYLPLVMISWFSSSVNWVVYSLTHSGFRAAVRRILRCRWKGSSTEDQSTVQ